MANYSTKLKDWGSKGSAHPDGYSYASGEQPVDVWDNFLTYNLIADVKHLINLTNDRLESDSGSAHPASPTPGDLSHRTDNETLSFYNSTNSVWERLLKVSGDAMEGQLDMGGYAITSSTGTVAMSGDATVSGGLTVDDSDTETEFFDKQEGGNIAAGSAVSIGTFELLDGEELYVSQGMLTEDGFNTVAPTGLDLIIVADDGTTTPPTTTVLAGDGTTLFASETGAPLASYTNTSGGTQTAMIALDNGEYGAGTGSDQKGYGGYIARIR